MHLRVQSARAVGHHHQTSLDQQPRISSPYGNQLEEGRAHLALCSFIGIPPTGNADLEWSVGVVSGLLGHVAVEQRCG